MAISAACRWQSIRDFVWRSRISPRMAQGRPFLSAKPNGTGQNVIVLSGLTPLHFSGHYTDVLPSINARLGLMDNLLLRAAASRVVSRPTLTDLSPAQTITSNPGNERISRGNPDLLPFRASQFEIG